MRGDLALPLEEVWRVATEEAGATMGNEQARGRACRIFPGMTKHTELLRDTIHDYDEGIDPTSSPHPPKVRPVPQSPTASTKPSRSRKRLTAEPSDVLVSAVISTYLLTHLHHVLQRAEYGAQQEGRDALAANYAELRKVLCLDARTMEDASACGTRESDEARQAA